MRNMRNTRTLILIQDAQSHGRATAPVVPRQEIEVAASGLSQVNQPGGKCEHGVYIPAAYLHTNIAPYCSICRPYEIIGRSPFKA